MTNKTKTFSLLLAGTFLSSPAVAADTLNFGADNLNALDRLKWSEVDTAGENTFEVQTPDGTKYLKYSYEKPGNFTLSHEHWVRGTENVLFENGEGRTAYNTSFKNNDFIGNSVSSDDSVGPAYSTYGGAVKLDVYGANISANGVFINNKVSDSCHTEHIYDIDNRLNVGNYSIVGGGAMGTWDSNPSRTDNLSISGQFINNSVTANRLAAIGGAFVNILGNADINISGSFVGNYAKSGSNSARGGAVGLTAYDFPMHGTVNIMDSDFINNYASGVNALGGAVYTEGNLTVNAENSDMYFIGNYVESNGIKKANDIYMFGSDVTSGTLELKTNAGRLIYFGGGIDGQNYNINITGGGEVIFDSAVENATALTIDNTALRLGTNGNVNAKNMSGSGTIKVDVTFADNNQIKTGVINAADELTGDYKVIANPLNDGSADYVGASSVFLTAPNDGATFDLARVVGSPYVWDISKENTESRYSWSLNLTDYEGDTPENPDDDKPSKPIARPIVPEVIAGAGLHEAAIEQTRSLVRNVRTKVADGRLYCPGCGIYDYGWNNQQLRNVWVLAQGETATIDKPVKADADIWGVEAGFDVQNDVNNTLGVFASYRKGEYDLSGKADKLRSNVGSEIDIDSYLAGLYYRYDKNMNWLFATVYGGVQQADAKTDDKIAKFDTDGIEFGAGIEAGHTFALSNDLTLDPSLGLYYTQINFDDAKDNVGKEYDWKDIKHLEAELGAKLEKQIDYAKIYVKPSVIQTITSGDSVKITGLNKLSTYDDATLGRIELGGRYGFTDALSAYGWVNYTFGSEYDATAFGAGVSYSW